MSVMNEQIPARKNAKKDKLPVLLIGSAAALIVLTAAIVVNVMFFGAFYSYRYFYSNAEITVRVENAPEGLYYIDMLALTHRGENGGAAYNHKMYNGDYEKGRLDRELSGYNREMIDILREYGVKGPEGANEKYRSRFGGYDAKDPLINVSNEAHTHTFTNTVSKSFYIIMVTEDKQTIVSPQIILRSQDCNITFDAQRGEVKQTYPGDLVFMPVMFIILLLSMMFTRSVILSDPGLSKAVNFPFVLLIFAFFHVLTDHFIAHEKISGWSVFIIPILSVIIGSMAEALTIRLIKREKPMSGIFREFVSAFSCDAFGWGAATILTFISMGIFDFIFGGII